MQVSKGFTLVELAIVITIIGLLIGGVLKGQELLENARLTSFVSQIKAYETAVTTYVSIYKELPGDGLHATERVTGCTVANSCANGDGNNLLGASTSAPWWSDQTTGVATENVQFWKHLALANLISGVEPNASTPAWGSSQPASPLVKGGFFAKTTTEPAEYLPTGLFIKAMVNISGTHDYSSISPFNAWRVDDKIDDGIAMKGSVVSVSYNWENGCGSPNAGTQGPTGYDIPLKTKGCQLGYHLGY